MNALAIVTMAALSNWLDWILPPPNTPMRRLYNTIFVTAGVQPPMPIMETISVRSMETVLITEPDAIAILPRDVVDELFKGGAIVPLQHRQAWKLPPVTFFCRVSLVQQPEVQALSVALRDAARRITSPRPTEGHRGRPGRGRT